MYVDVTLTSDSAASGLSPVLTILRCAGIPDVQFILPTSGAANLSDVVIRIEFAPGPTADAPVVSREEQAKSLSVIVMHAAIGCTMWQYLMNLPLTATGAVTSGSTVYISPSLNSTTFSILRSTLKFYVSAVALGLIQFAASSSLVVFERMVMDLLGKWTTGSTFSQSMLNSLLRFGLTAAASEGTSLVHLRSSWMGQTLGSELLLPSMSKGMMITVAGANAAQMLSKLNLIEVDIEFGMAKAPSTSTSSSKRARTSGAVGHDDKMTEEQLSRFQSLWKQHERRAADDVHALPILNNNRNGEAFPEKPLMGTVLHGWRRCASLVDDQAVVIPLIMGSVVRWRGQAAALAGNQTHSWTVYVRGPRNEDLSPFIEAVVFHLHSTFPEPDRVVMKAPFELTEMGWGQFIVNADIYFKAAGTPKLEGEFVSISSQGSSGQLGSRSKSAPVVPSSTVISSLQGNCVSASLTHFLGFSRHPKPKHCVPPDGVPYSEVAADPGIPPFSFEEAPVVLETYDEIVLLNTSQNFRDRVASVFPGSLNAAAQVDTAVNIAVAAGLDPQAVELIQEVVQKSASSSITTKPLFPPLVSWTDELAGGDYSVHPSGATVAPGGNGFVASPSTSLTSAFKVGATIAADMVLCPSVATSSKAPSLSVWPDILRHYSQIMSPAGTINTEAPLQWVVKEEEREFNALRTLREKLEAAVRSLHQDRIQREAVIVRPVPTVTHSGAPSKKTKAQ